MSGWVKAAQTSDLPEGSIKVVEAKGRRIALARNGGAFYAIEDLCTHDGGPLGEGTLEGEEVECPRHGARFNVKTGEAITLPAVVPVKTFPVKVDGNDVLIQI
ncbi:MAG: non-heme iron oxygenase ferredoxin subunit [Candidatus Omnitrophica bacterium]|nr:non-heme iron oxygenase ferredoxin subunit [Candidatus Omnitrophota bacterium]